MEQFLYGTPGEFMEGGDKIDGLNDVVFTSLINDPAYLSLFLSNPENLDLLTPEQLNVIQGYA